MRIKADRIESAQTHPFAHPFERRRLLGVDISVCKRDEAIAFLRARIDAGEKTSVAFANTNLLNKARSDADLRTALSSFFVFNDGVGLDLASWLRFGRKFPDNLNGTDLTPALLSAMRGKRVYLFGAAPGVAQAAAERIAETYGVEICGATHGFIEHRETLHIAINAGRPDIVLVALGNPLQEQWIHANRERIDAPLMMGVGAYFDFVSGTVQRAPEWMRRTRLEWAARLAQEPRRLLKRYTTEMASFMVAALLDRDAALRPNGSAAPK